MNTTSKSTEALVGLDLCVQAALARIAYVIDPDSGINEVLRTRDAGRRLGVECYRRSEHRMPILIESDPDLCGAWDEGYQNEAYFAARGACRHCNDLFSDEPCPEHGD